MNQNKSALTKRPGPKQAVAAPLGNLQRAVPLPVVKTSDTRIQAAAMKTCPLSLRSSGGRFPSSGEYPRFGLAHLSPKIVKFGNALGHQLQRLAKNSGPHPFATTHYNSWIKLL
jgi:hypothetical protein